MLFLPQLVAFLFGIDSGFDVVDRIYPQPQPREPFRQHPYLIYTHMYLNAAALFSSIVQMSLLMTNTAKGRNRNYRPAGSMGHMVLGWLYFISLSLGTPAALAYAWQQSYGSDGGLGASVGFTGIAMGSAIFAWLAVWCLFVKQDRAEHSLWMTRSFAAVLGSSVFFRVLANTFLVWIARRSTDIYPGWVAMIWMSWLIPLTSFEVYRVLTASSKPYALHINKRLS